MRVVMNTIKEISSIDIGDVDIEVFENLLYAMMDFICITLFQMWRNGDFKGAETFSDLLNFFNNRIMGIAHFDKKSIDLLIDEMNVALKAK